MFLCYIVQFAVSIVIVNGASKSKPQQYLSFFNGPQSFYLQQQATDTNSQKWYYSSNKKPIAYSWYWAVQDFPSSNFYKNTLPSKQNDRTVNWDCGRNQLANRFARIMGGQDAVPHSYPWMVSLAKRSLNNLHLCGGVLITRRHVLTAAHCMEDFNGINDLNVIVGAHYITDQRTSASVTAITTHPQYDPETFANDIAVITLRSSLSNNDPRIGIVCLPPDDIPGRVYPPMKASGVAIGWGTTFFGGEPSETLRQVILPILDPTTWPCNMYVTYVKGQICAGQLSGGADTCQADSGFILLTLLVVFLFLIHCRWTINDRKFK